MRFPKPFWRESKQAYYLQVGKRQMSLGPDEQEALRKYREICLHDLGGNPAQKAGDLTAAEVCDLFLEDIKGKASYEWYRHFTQLFVNHCGHVKASELKPLHLKGFLRKQSWGDTTKNKVTGIVARAFSWGVKNRVVAENPFAGIDRPRAKRRERLLTDAERREILAAIRDKPFRQFVTAMQETGARPGEVRKLTAAQVDLERGLWVLGRHKTYEKTGKVRVVYLTPEMKALSEELVALHPAGPLFRGWGKNPYSKDALRQRFGRLRKKLPHLEGVVAYSYRHAFCTDGLVRGVPIATMAELLGHADTTVIAKHYGHLSEQADHLRDAAKRARGA